MPPRQRLIMLPIQLPKLKKACVSHRRYAYLQIQVETLQMSSKFLETYEIDSFDIQTGAMRDPTKL